MAQSYEEGKKKLIQGLIILAVVTLVEVFISLLSKGHLIPGLDDYSWVLYTAGFIIAVLSFYKAYFIIYEFMHMRYEVSGLAMSVILPTVLLIWMVIAFLWEGSYWGDSRDKGNVIQTEYVESSQSSDDHSAVDTLDLMKEEQQSDHENEGNSNDGEAKQKKNITEGEENNSEQ